ncbi:hypothetical protein Tco_0918220 [Tanacetum coccineum]
MDEGTKNYSFDHIFAGSNPTVLVDKTKSTRDGLRNILKDTRSAFFTPDSSSDEPIIVSDESKEEEEDAKDKDTKSTSHNSQKEELEQAKAKAEGASIKLNPHIQTSTSLLNFYQVSLVQEKLKILDSLPSLLHKVTDTLNRFATMVENASGATSMNVPSASKATTSPVEGEKNTKDADTNLKDELVDLLCKNVVTQYYTKKLLFDKYC